jgi:RNA polymerase sigma-70 factor, ECF subfamily
MVAGSPAAAPDADSAPERQNDLDARLVAAIAERDQSALADAYNEHGSRVHAIARGLCGHTRAEDLTQEVFLWLWNNPERFDPERGSLRSYLLMQVHGRAIDVLRSDTARAAREVARTQRQEVEEPDTEAIALALLERADINQLVSALPSRERRPIVLAYFGGHTYREVARLLAVPEGTIKSRIRSGLQRLRLEGAAELYLN